MKLTPEQIQRKAQLIGRILSAVSEYHSAFGQAVPMKQLSAKFGKALKDLGGLPETIDELKAEGSIDVVLLKSGAKLVSPPGMAGDIQKDGRLLKA